jgi:hypothetical protein
MLSKRDQIARMIAGPRRPLPVTVKFTMDELREIVWTSHLTSAERATYEQAADLILEQVVQPLVDALEKISIGTVLVFDEETKQNIEDNMDADDMADFAYKALQEYKKP